MTVKQLREELSKYPDHMDVYLAGDGNDPAYELVEKCYAKEITFYDGSKELCRDTVVVIDEE